MKWDNKMVMPGNMINIFYERISDLERSRNTLRKENRSGKNIIENQAKLDTWHDHHAN